MGMDYIEGYKDAVQMFKDTIDMEVKKVFNTPITPGKKEVARVLDNFITTLYFANLQADRMESDYLESLKETNQEDNDYNEDFLGEEIPHEEKNCDDCDVRELCIIIGQGKTLKERAKEEF